VSTIIECPACSTRYKMNKAIPEGGRSVKCARCGHQWRLVPEGYEEEAASGTGEEDGSAVADEAAQADMPQGAAATAAEDDAAASWEARRQQFAAAMSSIREEQAGAIEQGASASPAGQRHAWEDDETAAQLANGRELSGGEAEPGFTEEDTNWADRIQQSWREAEEKQRGAVDEDPELAVRHALKAALEHPEETSAEPRAGRLAEPFDDFWQGFASDTGSGDEGLSYGSKDTDAVAAEIQSVRRSSVIYDSKAASHGFAEEEDADAPDPGIQSGIAQAFSEPVQRKAAPRQDIRHDESLTDYDAGAADQEPSSDGEDMPGGDFLERDAAAIQAELEGFGHLPYEEPRYGGLALVAAWAVFLSLVSGIILALVNFRDSVMVALPGTTNLYRAVGFDITDRRIDFGDVSYRWSVANGKPMVEVRGQIINRTDRQITVPRVQVNVRDTQTTDVMQALASVRSEPLAARQAADFTLELVLPSRTVSQIELEFDRAR
jgi:predicted Zn finger-like uncharacterized protein